jgi:hypothetical protein
MMSAICTQRSWQDHPLKSLNPIELNVVDALSATRGRQTRSAPVPPQLEKDIQAVCIKGLGGGVLSPFGLTGS